MREFESISKRTNTPARDHFIQVIASVPLPGMTDQTISAISSSKEEVTHSTISNTSPSIVLSTAERIPFATLDDMQKPIVDSLLEMTASTISNSSKTNAHHYLGPSIYSLTNATNREVANLEITWLKAQVEVALQEALYDVFKNHVIAKQTLNADIIYRTNNSAKLVEMTGAKTNTQDAITSRNLKLYSGKSNNEIIAEQDKILEDYRTTFSGSEISHMIKRIKAKHPQLSIKTNKDICNALREEWISISYLAPETKTEILKPLLQSALEKTKNKILENAANQHLNDELIAILQRHIDATITTMMKRFDLSDTNNDIKDTLYSAHMQLKQLKKRCDIYRDKTLAAANTFKSNKSTAIDTFNKQGKDLDLIIKSQIGEVFLGSQHTSKAYIDLTETINAIVIREIKSAKPDFSKIIPLIDHGIIHLDYKSFILTAEALGKRSALENSLQSLMRHALNAIPVNADPSLDTIKARINAEFVRLHELILIDNNLRNATNDQLSDEQPSAYWRKKVCLRIDTDLIIRAAQNNSDTPSFQAEDSAALPKIQFQPFIPKPTVTIQEKKAILSLIEKAQVAVVNDNLPLATALLGPSFFELANNTNHEIKLLRDQSVRHQIEYALTLQAYTIMENFLTDRQTKRIRLTYETSNGSALVHLVNPSLSNPNKINDITKDDIAIETENRNKFISTENQTKILSDFYEKLPTDEVRNLIDRVNAKVPGSINPLLKGADLKKIICYYLREKWFTAEYLNLAAKTELLKKIENALQLTATELLNSILPLMEKNLRDENPGITIPTIQSINNKLRADIDALINATIKDINNGIDSAGGKTIKVVLLSLSEKVNTLKSISDQDSKKINTLIENQNKDTEKRKGDFLNDQSFAEALTPLGLTPQDIIDAKIGELSFFSPIYRQASDKLVAETKNHKNKIGSTPELENFIRLLASHGAIIPPDVELGFSISTIIAVQLTCWEILPPNTTTALNTERQRQINDLNRLQSLGNMSLFGFNFGSGALDIELRRRALSSNGLNHNEFFLRSRAITWMENAGLDPSQYTPVSLISPPSTRGTELDIVTNNENTLLLRK